MQVTAEKVFAILYGKNLPQRHNGHEEKDIRLIFSFVFLVS
jgi:hypothetical protein